MATIFILLSAAHICALRQEIAAKADVEIKVKSFVPEKMNFSEGLMQQLSLLEDFSLNTFARNLNVQCLHHRSAKARSEAYQHCYHPYPRPQT